MKNNGQNKQTSTYVKVMAGFLAGLMVFGVVAGFLVYLLA